MKKIMGIFTAFLLAGSVNAQVKKDTVKVDSTQMEKIKKMPMDTVFHKMPIKPVLPEEQKHDNSINSPIQNPKKK